MRRNTIVFIIATTTLIACGQANQSAPDSIDINIPKSSENVRSRKHLTGYNDKNIYTRYEYTDSSGASLIIQNSFPKSGINYTDPNGKKYVYAVFWTRIINETVDPFELRIDFPSDSFEIPSSSGNYMKLLLPSDTLTIDKEPLFDYGLAIQPFLDSNRHQSPSLTRTINQKGSGAFYVVSLSNHGVGGTLRTGLIIKEQNLFYNVNGKEIPCGQIDFKRLMLQK